MDKILNDLKDRGSKIEITNVRGVCFVNIYDHLNSDIISNSVFTGVDANPSIAFNKALSEMIERMSFTEGYLRGDLSCQTKTSDGFAALPISLFKNNRSETKMATRENAFSEAVERFVWATWWDMRTHAEIKRINIERFNDELLGFSNLLLQDLRESLPFNEIILIKPKITNSINEVSIYFVPLLEGGYISGGAAGNNLQQNTERAIAELYRHGVAWKRVKQKGISAKTFYEKRLLYFASGQGDRLVVETLEMAEKSTINITLPMLSIDEEIPHQYSSLYISHRCLFKNQPPFVGGELERLCL